MLRPASSILLVSCLAFVSACNGSVVTPPENAASSRSSASSSDSVRETRNVTYRGTVEPLGATIYMQGTHRLTLGDGRMLLLESSLVDLEDFVSNEVEVFGSLRPTVEAGGIIMRVERITDLDASSIGTSSTASEVPSSVAESSRGAVASPAAISSKAQSQASSVALLGADAGLDARIAIMASHDLSPSQWTQRYCSDHVGFCVPIHRNWWFRSFGSTTSTLWHVEANSEDFETLGSGPIAIDLVGGDLPNGAFDASVVTNGSSVVGYRSWTQGRHIAIRADAHLRSAVEYMTQNLEVTATE